MIKHLEIGRVTYQYGDWDITVNIHPEKVLFEEQEIDGKLVYVAVGVSQATPADILACMKRAAEQVKEVVERGW